MWNDTFFLEKSDLVSAYTPIMQILGGFIVVIGVMVLYLIWYHSGKIEKQYKRALLVHQSLSWSSYLVLNVAFIPVNLPPYALVYPEGLLKDISPIIVIAVVQLSTFTVGITSRGLLFHLRALAVLPPDHFLARTYVFYPMVVYYFVPAIVMSPILIPFACYDQQKIKEEWFEIFQMFREEFFDTQKLAWPINSTPFMFWTYGTSGCVGSFIIITVTFAARTLTVLNNLKVSMSSTTRLMHRKLTVSLIIQTACYNLIYVVITLMGFAFSFIGLDNGREVFVLIILTYSTSFLLGSVLMILTNDSYRRAIFNSWHYVLRRRPSHASSVFAIQAAQHGKSLTKPKFQRLKK